MSKEKKSQQVVLMHRFSGIFISIFVALHLFNHLMSLGGVTSHIQTMESIRPIYRNIVVESLLMLAVVIQIVSGVRIFLKRRKLKKNFWLGLQLNSGMYLAIFLLIHVGAVLGGRMVLGLDTNFHFASAGLNGFPFSLFFIPYYSLAILSFWGHVAAIHAQKMKRSILGISAQKQAFFFLGIGLIITLLTVWGFTNGFQGHPLPIDYHILIGK